MNTRFALGFALLFAFAPACTAMQIARPGTIPMSTSHVAPDQRLAAWNRSVAALIEAGFIPQVFNDTTCYVSGRRRDDLGSDILSGAMAVVQILPDGDVRVQISGVGLFSTQDDLNAEITRRQDELLRNIVHATPAAS